METDWYPGLQRTHYVLANESLVLEPMGAALNPARGVVGHDAF